MKSIKEKAKEVFPRHCNANTDASNLKKRIGFNSGANYVLDEIEEIINHPLRFVNANKTIEESMIKEISKLVEQLKK